MRDPKRIKSILDKIKVLWDKYPDWRFGQLLINYNIIPDDFRTWTNDDDGFEKYLDDIIIEEKKGEKKWKKEKKSL